MIQIFILSMDKLLLPKTTNGEMKPNGMLLLKKKVFHLNE